MFLSFWKTPTLAERHKTLENEVNFFFPIIGGWPTKIQSQAEANVIHKRWTKAEKIARSLFEEQPANLDVKFLTAELLRMGHNLGVPNVAQLSDTMFQQIIVLEPENPRGYFSLASLYVTSNASLAPEAERLFRKAEGLMGSKVDPNVYQGLGFACVYQNKIPEAIVNIETYLRSCPSPEFQQMVTALKSGKKPEIIQK